MDSRLKKHILGFLEVAEKPALGELQKYYAEKYFQEAKGSYELEYSQEELMFFRARLEQRKFVLDRHLSNLCVKKILDVGCGEGYALAYFRDQGWDVKGFDFSEAGVKSKNPDCVSVLKTGDVFSLVDDEIAVGETYDAVLLQNVLEHVVNPPELLKSLRSLVLVNGILVVTVPNDYSITQQEAISKKHIDKEFWVAPPEHLSYFNYASLLDVSRATGWDCLEVLADYPVDWFLFHPGSNYVVHSAAGKAAHKARVQIENLIHKQPIGDVVQFWSAAAKLGFGRNITAFLRPAKVK